MLKTLRISKLSKNNEPWVQSFSEKYEACIVGNREGLLLLKKSIDEAIDEKFSTPSYKTDFISVVCTKEKWEESYNEELPKWQEFMFSLIAALWLGLLPIVGIVFVILWFR